MESSKHQKAKCKYLAYIPIQALVTLQYKKGMISQFTASKQILDKYTIFHPEKRPSRMTIQRATTPPLLWQSHVVR